MQQFFGILPAVITPVDSNEHFHLPTFETLLNRLFQARVDGIYVCGQTGEGLQQSTTQRMRVAEAAVALAPKGKQVIIHIGAGSTREARHLAAHASDIGATAVSSLPPYGAYSFEEVRDYYRAIAEASSVPLFVYYFPSIAPGITRLDQLLELCAIPNVAGMKYTDSDLYKLSELAHSGAIIYAGSDEMLVASLLRGASGGIGSIYNLLPDLFVELFSLTRAGRWAEASALQDRINVLIRIVLHHPVNPAIKTLLRWSGIDCGPCLKPRRELTVEEEQRLRARIEQTEFAARFRVPA